MRVDNKPIYYKNWYKTRINFQNDLLNENFHFLTFDAFKVIPLKLFYYQTFFEILRNEHSWHEH